MPAKMAEQIEVLFAVETPGGPGNILLDVDPDPLVERGRLRDSIRPLPNYFGSLF